MSFTKTRDSLDNLSSQKMVSMEDALSVILDFCEDFDDDICRLPVEDSKCYLQYMRKCNRFMLDIMRHHDLSRMHETGAEKLQKQAETLAELSRRLEEEEKKVADQADVLDQRRRLLMEKQDALKRDAEAIEREMMQLEEQNDLLGMRNKQRVLERIQLQDEIANLSDKLSLDEKKIKEEEIKKKLLEDEQKQRLARLELLSEEINGLRQVIDHELKPELDKRMTIFESKKAENDLLSGKLKDLFEMNEKLASDLEIKKSVIQEKENRQSELLQSIAAGQDRLQAITMEVQRLRLAVQSEDREGLLRELEEKKRELSGLVEEHRQLQDELAGLAGRIERLQKELPQIHVEITNRRREEGELSEQKKRADELTEMLNRHLYEFESMQERLSKLKKISSLLEQDMRILQKKEADESYTLEEGMEDTLAHCEAVVKKIRKSMQAYIKQASELQ